MWTSVSPWSLAVSNLAFPAALYDADADADPALPAADADADVDADVDFTTLAPGNGAGLDDIDVPGAAPVFTSHAAAFVPGEDMDEEITSSAAAYLGKDSEKTATAKPIDSNSSAPSPEEQDNQETALPGDIGLPEELDWRKKMDIGPLYSQARRLLRTTSRPMLDR